MTSIARERDDFFAKPPGVPADFLADRDDPALEEREPF